MAFGAYVQAAETSVGTNETTSNLAYGSNNAVNALLIAWARLYGTPGTVSVVDTRSNTWIPTINLANTNDSLLTLYGFHVLAGSAGANTVTLNTTGAVTRRWIILEYEGPGVLDDTTAQEGTTPGTSPTAGDLVTTVATELLVKVMAFWADTVATVGASFTERIATAADRTNAADRLVTSTGTYPTAYSATGDEPWIMLAASFYQAGGSGSFVRNERSGIRGLNRGLFVG